MLGEAWPGWAELKSVDDKTKHKEACPESIAPQDSSLFFSRLLCFCQENIHDPRVSDEL